MKKPSLSILLILVMLITPIASVFDHCAGLDMSGHFSEMPSSSDTSLADHKTPLEHKKMLNGSQNNQLDVDCHSNGRCTLHVCGTDVISSSAPTIHSATAAYYLIFEYASPYSTVLSPALRPPKQSL